MLARTHVGAHARWRARSFRLAHIGVLCIHRGYGYAQPAKGQLPERSWGAEPGEEVTRRVQRSSGVC
eukprot:6212769-Pleurochrysis_carterae.AAC.1